MTLQGAVRAELDCRTDGCLTTVGAKPAADVLLMLKTPAHIEPIAFEAASDRECLEVRCPQATTTKLRVSGAELECGFVRELTLQAPLVLEENGKKQLQLKVGEADETGARSLTFYSRTAPAFEDVSEGESEWVCNAIGSLGPGDSGGVGVAGLVGEGLGVVPLGEERARRGVSHGASE